MIRQAVILCGGKGTRLGSLTAETPKPLLPVGDRPFIEHLIQEVTRYGISEIILLTGHLGEQFDRYNGTTINHAQIRVHREETPLGTWGGVVQACELLDPWFLLMNGDSWLDYDLTSMLLKQPDTMHMLGRYVSPADRYETLEVNKENVKAIVPRGQATGGFINSGIYVVNREVVKISAPGHSSLEQYLLPWLAETGTLTVDLCQSNTFFIDIGVPEDYERAQVDLIAQRTRPALFVDRDNTLTYDREGYTHHPDDMEFKPGAMELIHLANRMGWYVFVVTNQGGVTKGVYEEHYILDFHRKMQYTLAEFGAHIDGLEYEIELVSRRRKPRPGMIEALIASWPIELGPSFMVGDKLADREAGIAAGIGGYCLQPDDNIFEKFGAYIF